MLKTEPQTSLRSQRARRQADMRREEILDASERIFAIQGYHATGIADIARELGMGHGTFYRYFKSKHDIAQHVISRLMHRFAEVGLAEDPQSANTLEEYRTQSSHLLERWLTLAQEHPHVLRFFHEQTFIIDANRLAEIVEGYVAYTERFLQNGVARQFLRVGLDVRATAEMLVALIFEGTRRVLGRSDADARRRWVEAGLALMFEGIGGPHKQ